MWHAYAAVWTESASNHLCFMLGYPLHMNQVTALLESVPLWYNHRRYLAGLHPISAWPLGKLLHEESLS